MATQAPVENKVTETESQAEQSFRDSQLASDPARGLLVEEDSQATTVTSARKLPLSEQLSAGKIYGFRG